MTWKKLFLILLLLTAVAATPFYILEQGWLEEGQERIITELENSLEMDIEVEEINWLPLNQLRLTDLTLSRSEEIDIYLPEAVIYYDFSNLLQVAWNSLADLNNFDLGEGLLASFKQLKVIEPEVYVSDPEGELLTELDLDEDMEIPDPAPIWRELPPLPAGAGLVVQGGEIFYQERESSLALALQRLEIIVEDEQSLAAGLGGSLELTGLQLPAELFTAEEAVILESLELPELELALELSAEEWEIRSDLKAELDQLQPITAELAADQELPLEGLNFSGEQQLGFTGEGYRDELESFKVEGITELSQLGLEDPELKLENISWGTSYHSEKGHLLLDDLKLDFLDHSYQGQGNVQLPDFTDYFFTLSGEGIALAPWQEFLAEEFSLDLPQAMMEEEDYDDQPAGLADSWPREADFTLNLSSGSFDSDNFASGPEEKGPALGAEISLNGSNIGQEELITEVAARWQQDRLWLDDLSLNTSEGQELLRAQGDYKPASEEYNFQLEVADMDLERWQQSLVEVFPAELAAELGLEEVMAASPGGDFRANFTGSGEGLSLEDLLLAGEISLTDFRLQEEEFFPAGAFQASEISSAFWLSEGRMEVGPARADTELAELELGGEVDLLAGEMDLRLETGEVDLTEIGSLTGLNNELTGRGSLSGRLTGTLESPGISASLALPEAEIFGVEVVEGYGNLFYFSDRDLISIRGLDFTSRGAEVQGQGDLSLAAEEPELTARLDIAELTYQYINEIFDIGLPLEGDVSGIVEVEGPFSELEVNSEATSRSTILPLGEGEEQQVFEFTNASSSFYWQTGEPFQVIDLKMEKEEALFTMDGAFSEEFWVDYSISDFPLQGLEFEELEDLSGLASASGELEGSYDNPAGETHLEIEELAWAEEDLGSLKADLTLADDVLTLVEADWQPGPGQYTLRGEVESLLDEPRLDLTLDLAEVELNHYLKRLALETPLDIDYLLSGELNLTGSPTDFQAGVDLLASSESGELGQVSLQGDMTDEFDVELIGEDIQLGWLDDFFEPEVAFSGQMEFAGELKGPLEEPDFELRTLARDIEVGPYEIAEIAGEANLIAGEILTISQELVAEPGQYLNLSARLPWQEPAEAEFLISAADFPLDPVAELMPQLEEIVGSLEGEVEATGASLEEISTAGDLLVDISKVDFGQQETLELGGNFNFSGGRMELEDFTGYLDGGQVDFSGGLNLNQQADFWDLTAKTRALPLFYQGSEVDITGELTFSGAMLNPLLAGEITFNNLIAVLPEDVAVPDPTGEGEEPPRSNFQPEMDLKLIVGDNNYFQHDNAEVQIQRGELRLLYSDNFEIDGELASNQGSVYFYNNRFTLETARLDFSRRRGIIPRATVRARTEADNHEIQVNIDGPADNLSTTFASTPEREEEEIISLLLSRGGLGGVLAGQEYSMPQVIQQEFMRFLREQLEFELLADVSARLRRALELDRFELVSEGGLLEDQEMTLYMGMDLTDRLYLESESRFGFDERDTSLSFRYYLSERTFLDGTFNSFDDFSFTLETGFEF